MKHTNFTALSANDTASHNGMQIDTNQWVQCSFQAVFGDSSATGTLIIQASNDICNDQYQPNTFTVANWTQVGSASVTSGASVMISFADMAYRWMRVVYTSASGGSSTITVNANALSA